MAALNETKAGLVLADVMSLLGCVLFSRTIITCLCLALSTKLNIVSKTEKTLCMCEVYHNWKWGKKKSCKTCSQFKDRFHNQSKWAAVQCTEIPRMFLIWQVCERVYLRAKLKCDWNQCIFRYVFKCFHMCVCMSVWLCGCVKLLTPPIYGHLISWFVAL